LTGIQEIMHFTFIIPAFIGPRDWSKTIYDVLYPPSK
jgi:hypothetical protein